MAFVKSKIVKGVASSKAEDVSTKARPANCAASCYEVEPGRWIHRPEHGCKTLALMLEFKPPRTFKRVCWHCGGLKVCTCLVCRNRQTDKSGPCIPCRGTGEVDTHVFAVTSRSPSE